MNTYRVRGTDGRVHAVPDPAAQPPGAPPRRALCGRTVLLVCTAPVEMTCPACVAGAGGPEVSFAYEPCG